MRRTALTLAAFVASLALAGCAGGDDEASSRPAPGNAGPDRAPARSGEAPTRARFVRRAEELCAKARRQAAPLADAARANVADEDASGVAAEVRKGIPIADELLARLRALTPPRGDGAIFGSYISAIAEQRRRIPPLVEALEAEDISTIEVLVAELRQTNRRARRLAVSYGFRQCVPPGLPGV